MTAKEEGRRPDWQDICHGSEVLNGYWGQWKSLTLENGLLKRAWESADGQDVVMQLIVPRSKLQSVSKEMHDGTSRGHLGVNKTLDNIRTVSYTHLDVYKRQGMVQQCLWQFSQKVVQRYTVSFSPCFWFVGPC